MKILYFFLSFFLCTTSALYGQDSFQGVKGLHFTDEIVLPATGVKNQYRTSNCWTFGAISFLESEMLRMKRPAADLSEMFTVFYSYSEKAERYVRMHGKNNFSAGGEFHDVLHTIKKYGIVPESVYPGPANLEEKPVQNDMDQVLKEEVDEIVQNPERNLFPEWHESFVSKLESWLGKIPEKFEYQGKNYTPQSFAREFTGLDMDDYVEITSYSHHPYYTSFIPEFPDNWSWSQACNVPLNVMEEILDNSLKKGFTVAWACDSSEKGFLYDSNGVAFVPCKNTENMTPEERRRWMELSEKEREVELYDLDNPLEELEITQELRQVAFDNYKSTDDHGVHIIGTARDQTGKIWYKVKNSWGDAGTTGGYFYASRAYVRYKTTCLLVNKDAIPPSIRKKLGI